MSATTGRACRCGAPLPANAHPNRKRCDACRPTPWRRPVRPPAEFYAIPSRLDLSAVAPALARLRVSGASFESAWREVVGDSTLGDSKTAWRRAYLREPETRADRAAAKLWRAIANPND